MTKKLLLIIFPALLALVAFPVNSCLAQQPSKNQPLTTTEVEAYKLQAHQLVKFMEYAFNSLGSSHATAREKDIIIQQSFLKFFKNSKVQIEDDLIEGRFVVTNKDVQAYLKDIDFFFKQVAFEFQIEDIAYHVNNRSQVFFIVKTYRTLEGITVENEPIKNNQLRYIEINLDPEHRDLKIASIYTTRLSEKEDMRQWWKHLDTEWRQFLAQGTPFGDQYMMRDVLSFDDKWMVIERRQMVTINEYQLESHRPDTIFINAGGMYSEIRRLWRIEELDLSKHTFFEDISPLSKLTQLRHLNLSKTSVDDLTPIRNLTRLETLDFSETKVLSIESLRFAINLKNLYFNKTGVHDLETLTGITALERLHANNTQISDISPVHSLENLRDLRLANTWVSNLSPLLQLKTLQILDVSSTRIKSLNDLRNLVQLERLHADNTSVTDLSPIKDLPKLQFISIEATELSDIMVLKSLPDLKRIYCDRTLIGHEKASQFAREKPGVLVVYESQALSDWWQTLPEAWNSIFKSQVEISPLPTREELHDLANLISIDISNNQEITSIEALHKLSKLKTIKAANTSIQSIASLKENFDLQWLDISGTGIDDLSPLASLKNLEYLNLSTTNIKSILPLVNNKQLRHVVMENTMVESINPLTKLNNLELVYADRINM
ncbi:MAG: hypothetical protein Q8M23_00380, partial [Bacteroidales bacterium]|nr:hypothetical protein [Bacteroidales bacterium]